MNVSKLTHPSHAAILLAAGSSQRMGRTGADKILMPIDGKPTLAYSITAFLKSGITTTFWVTYRDACQLQALQTIASAFPNASFHWVAGGATRALSVLNALKDIPNAFDYVFIHDAARPLITTDALLKLKGAVTAHGAAVLAHKVKDTIKRIPRAGLNSGPVKLEDLDRTTLWAMETPQAFKCGLIREAYITAPQIITDDTAAASLAGHTIQIVENTQPNPKLTTAADTNYIEYLLSKKNSQFCYNA